MASSGSIYKGQSEVNLQGLMASSSLHQSGSQEILSHSTSSRLSHVDDTILGGGVGGMATMASSSSTEENILRPNSLAAVGSIRQQSPAMEFLNHSFKGMYNSNTSYKWHSVEIS